MRELDVLLEAYLEQRYPHAGPAEQAAFRALVALEDPELKELLLGRAPGGGPLADVVAGVLDSHRHR